MSPPPTSVTAEQEPGQLLKELEQRQDEVLEQLEARYRLYLEESRLPYMGGAPLFGQEVEVLLW